MCVRACMACIVLRLLKRLLKCCCDEPVPLPIIASVGLLYVPIDLTCGLLSRHTMPCTALHCTEAADLVGQHQVVALVASLGKGDTVIEPEQGVAPRDARRSRTRATLRRAHCASGSTVGRRRSPRPPCRRATRSSRPARPSRSSAPATRRSSPSASRSSWST